MLDGNYSNDECKYVAFHIVSIMIIVMFGEVGHISEAIGDMSQ